MSNSHSTVPVHSKDVLEEEWPNDDLLIEPSIREYFYQHFEDVAPVFDASDLHNLFKAHDEPANEAKRRSRAWGLIAIALGFSSLSLAACTPLILRLIEHLAISSTEYAGAVLGTLISVFAVISVIVGYVQALTGRSKREWLTHRLWTERIRELHFQIIINNLDVATTAVGTRNYDQWQQIRDREIQRFINIHMASAHELFEILRSDQAEEMVWTNPEWNDVDNVAVHKEPSDEFIEIYRQQRFGVQLRYARLRLRGHLGSVRFQSQAISFLTNALIILAVANSVSLAIMHLMGLGLQTLTVQAAMSTLGLLGAVVITLRALEEGMKPTAETDRLEWYLAAVTGLQARFDEAESISSKFRIMRDMERLSYQEMRRFFITADRSRFIL